MPEYTALLREAGHHPRDAAILELLLQTGIRLSELTALTIDDVSLPAKPSLDPVNGYGLLRVRRKGRRLQELILNYKACRALKGYLRARPASAEPALFLTKYQEPITGRSVQKLMKKYAARVRLRSLRRLTVTAARSLHLSRPPLQAEKGYLPPSVRQGQIGRAHV